MRAWQELAWRLLPGALVAVLVGGLHTSGLTQQIEQLNYNLLFRLRGERPWDDRIAIIAIDDPSLKKLGRYPWPRRRFTQLMQVLNQTETSAIVFDVIFSEATKDDPALAQAIAQNGRVILAQAVDFTGLPLQPVPQLQNASLATGNIYRQTDGDGMTRKIRLTFRDAPALSVVAVQAHGMQQRIPPLPHPDSDLWLNWSGSAQRIQQYSFADVIDGRIPPSLFQDKIVVVGVSATGFDTLLTPFDRNPPVTGVYLQATAIQNLLAQNSLQRPLAGGWFSSLLLLAMPGLGLGLSYLKVKWQILLIGGVSVLWWSAAVVALGANYYVPTVLPISLIIGTAIAVAIIERLRMQAVLQKQLQQLVTTYLPSAPLALSQTGELRFAAAERSQTDAFSHLASPSPPPIQRGRLAALRNSPLVDCLARLRGALPRSQPASIHALNQLMQIATQLGQAQATQQAITQSISVGILAIDQAGVIWFGNERAQQWLQVAIGDRLGAALVPHWIDALVWEQIFQGFLDQQLEPPEATRDHSALPSMPAGVVVIEVLVNDRWFALNFALLQTTLTGASHCADQSVVEISRDGHSLLLLIEDITQRKQLETNLERQIQELQWLAQLKDELIGRVSHELRSPITNMLMSIELLRTTESPEQQRYYLNLLEQECRQECNFINDLLSLQATAPEPPSPSLTRIELAPWLDNLVAPFLARASNRQQQIQIEVAPDLPPLYTDVTVLERIYKELLTNACKYSPAGAVIYCTIGRHQDMVHLSVRNLGVTIPPEELPRIFDKFYRIPASDPWKQGGTGLGLSIVDRLAKQIQANIAVRSEADVTEFQLQLPLQPDSDHDAAR